MITRSLVISLVFLLVLISAIGTRASKDESDMCLNVGGICLARDVMDCSILKETGLTASPNLQCVNKGLCCAPGLKGKGLESKRNKDVSNKKLLRREKTAKGNNGKRNEDDPSRKVRIRNKNNERARGKKLKPLHTEGNEEENQMGYLEKMDKKKLKNKSSNKQGDGDQNMSRKNKDKSVNKVRHDRGRQQKKKKKENRKENQVHPKNRKSNSNPNKKVNKDKKGTRKKSNRKDKRKKSKANLRKNGVKKNQAKDKNKRKEVRKPMAGKDKEASKKMKKSKNTHKLNKEKKKSKSMRGKQRNRKHACKETNACRMAGGTCIKNSSSCPAQVLPKDNEESLCIGTSCKCCQVATKALACKASAECKKYKGNCKNFCSKKQRNIPNSCSGGESCTCCAKKCKLKKKCKRESGKCRKKCKNNEEEISGGCKGYKCTCCVSICQPQEICVNSGGYCVKRKKDCPTGKVDKTCAGARCRCCLPDPTTEAKPPGTSPLTIASNAASPGLVLTKETIGITPKVESSSLSPGTTLPRPLPSLLPVAIAPDTLPINTSPLAAAVTPHGANQDTLPPRPPVAAETSAIITQGAISESLIPKEKTTNIEPLSNDLPAVPPVSSNAGSPPIVTTAIISPDRPPAITLPVTSPAATPVANISSKPYSVTEPAVSPQKTTMAFKTSGTVSVPVHTVTPDEVPSQIIFLPFTLTLGPLAESSKGPSIFSASSSVFQGTSVTPQHNDISPTPLSQTKGQTGSAFQYSTLAPSSKNALFTSPLENLLTTSVTKDSQTTEEGLSISRISTSEDTVSFISLAQETTLNGQDKSDMTAATGSRASVFPDSTWTISSKEALITSSQETLLTSVSQASSTTFNSLSKSSLLSTSDTVSSTSVAEDTTSNESNKKDATSNSETSSDISSALSSSRTISTSLDISAFSTTIGWSTSSVQDTESVTPSRESQPFKPSTSHKTNSFPTTAQKSTKTTSATETTAKSSLTSEITTTPKSKVKTTTKTASKIKTTTKPVSKIKTTTKPVPKTTTTKKPGFREKVKEIIEDIKVTTELLKATTELVGAGDELLNGILDLFGRKRREVSERLRPKRDVLIHLSNLLVTLSEAEQAIANNDTKLIILKTNDINNAVTILKNSDTSSVDSTILTSTLQEVSNRTEVLIELATNLQTSAQDHLDALNAELQDLLGQEQ